MTTIPTAAAPAPSPARPRLPLTPGRGFALALGVPVALLLIAYTGFGIVGDLGRASYPVSAVVPIHDGRFAMNDSGGDVNLIGDGAPGAVRLTGRVSYSLVRPALSFSPGDAATPASVRMDCPLASMANCGLNARLDIPAGTAVTTSTGGGNMTVRGLTSAVSLSTSGGDVSATDLTGAVSVSTGGGNVTVSQVTGILRLHTSGGDITGTAVTSTDVTAGSGGGNIQLTFTTVPRRVNVSTSGGDVTIIVPPGRYYVNPRTAGGNISAIHSDQNAANVINVSTGGGNITIAESP